LKATLIDSSKKYLTEQIGLIGERITSEVNDLFEAKLYMAASSFLYPVAFGLFDAYDTPALDPPPTHAAGRVTGCAEPLMCLRPPTTFDNRDPDDLRGSFRCALPTDPSAHGSFKNLCSDWDGSDSSVQTSGGCSCKGQKTLSPTASSVFITGMDGTESTSASKLDLFTSDRPSSMLDVFVSESWRNNLDWIQVYLGVRHPELPSISLFRSFPGSVRERLGDPTSAPGEGRFYDAGARPWFKVAEDNKIDNTDLDRKTQLQAYRPQISLTAPYMDADGKGDLVSLAVPLQRHRGQFAGVIGIDMVVSSLRETLKTIKTRESGETFIFHLQTRKVLASLVE